MNTPRQVLVAGGTSGIGAGIARAFAAAGDHVVATGGTAAEVNDFAAAPDLPAHITPRLLDVRDDAAVRALVQGLGEIDVVVNCAGIIRRGAEHEHAHRQVPPALCRQRPGRGLHRPVHSLRRAAACVDRAHIVRRTGSALAWGTIPRSRGERSRARAVNGSALAR